ncbi:hypothetical protein PR048_024091 [Dryococelus australis]|uniref:Uncharacterized protein n=1 Tax=Dryococelus australis TaxID=614101 RepID=A0ABQ9GVY2_9NEOP|nr:hypothetical protein PR048_024091 [Dryococelus australis]
MTSICKNRMALIWEEFYIEQMLGVKKMLEMQIVDSKILTEGINLEEPLNLFIDLIELEYVTAKGIFSSLM